MATLRSIDLRLREELKDPEFRRAWFRAQLGAAVPDMFRKLREMRKLTQKKIALEADMKQSAISRFEKSDEANWNFETLLKLADAVDIKLTIGYELAEDVIAEYQRKEASGDTVPSSVLEERGKAQNSRFNENKSGARRLSAFTEGPKLAKPEARDDIIDRGHRPWN